MKRDEAEPTSDPSTGHPTSRAASVAAADGRPVPPPPEDLEGALRFMHLLQAQTQARVAELSASLNALTEALIGEGTLPLDTYEKRKRLTILRENARSASEASIEVSDIPDKYALESPPPIDCAARLPLCQARCCTLTFALSVQDLDERVVRWNYARPYRIAQGPDGRCVHNEAGGCSIYEHRPGVCRSYDCREDRRIWLDFEQRVPAP
ncbi:YkgJ family cysteine cluster protein [Chondromyces crocatus]|uniref:Zinc/iron-chelating domain-containing protein n=1 Tax=Chondromyces crocatus TaxID=52 RepID=A0A0K1ESU6_CHOCO|nr:zinc/iron-chelating domain-containing protein [Chondromyces crocatus]AKT43712.1 uncharacterized protein CMC5_079470 [Chondromyces crocatus]